MKPKRVLIDCSAIQGRSWKRGIGKYSQTLITNLKNSEKIEYEYLISNFEEFRPLEDILDFLTSIADRAAIHIWKYEISLSSEVNQLVRESFVKSLECDELLITDLFEARHHIPISINKFTNIPTTVILYDLIPLEDPNTYLSTDIAKKIYFDAISDLKNSDSVWCISEYAKESVVTNIPELSTKATVIGGGPNSNLRKISVRKKNQVISVLGDDPRKNVSRLLLSWSQLPHNILDHYDLIIVGAFSEERIRYFKNKYLLKQVAFSSVQFTGEISDELLENLLNESIALIHPAISEGLGLPILEAIRLSIPAICSMTSSMVEIGALGACFDPDDMDSMLHALKMIIEEEDFRERVLASQQEVGNKYNWPEVIRRVDSSLHDSFAAQLKKDPKMFEVGQTLSGRIAVIAPGVSQKTGISRFTRDLHPHLASLADVDLIPTESLDDLSECLKLLANYDQVLIHLGNSEHHKNAFKLATVVPSVIICHDVKFGNTLKNIHSQNPEWMPELADLKLLDGDRLELLSLQRILTLALGVVVHSDTAFGFLQRARIPRNKILKIDHPFLLNIPDKVSRGAHGSPLMEIVSAGFITPNKGLEKIIEAVSLANASELLSLKLRLLGEVDPYYGAQLRNFAKEHSVSLEITGYLDDVTYLNELQQAKLAIQLRTTDSGEASGVLADLLFLGTPTILNDFGSFKSIPDDVVRKVIGNPESKEIASAILEMRNEMTRSYFSENAWNYARFRISPGDWALSVLIFSNHRHKFDLVENVRKFKTIIKQNEITTLVRACRAIEREERRFGSTKFIASDISNLKETKFLSGIQRATLEIHKEIHKTFSEQEYLPIGLDLNQKISKSVEIHPQILSDRFVTTSSVDYGNIDALLLLDLNFNVRNSSVLTELSNNGIPIIANVYDVLPISNPEWFPPMTAKNLFLPWLESVLRYSSDIVVNSRSTQDELQKLAIFDTFKGDIHISPLGVPATNSLHKVSRNPHQSLIVGTIEPRKGHSDVIDAFDIIATQYSDATLHLVGRQGWMVESLIERINNHPLLNIQLFWHQECSDDKLIELYRQSAITVVASEGEGFGLPLIEALKHGSHVIARDIPVFREIGAEKVTFFDSDASNLIAVWTKVLADPISSSFTVEERYDQGYAKYAILIRHILDNRWKV